MPGLSALFSRHARLVEHDRDRHALFKGPLVLRLGLGRCRLDLRCGCVHGDRGVYAFGGGQLRACGGCELPRSGKRCRVSQHQVDIYEVALEARRGNERRVPQLLVLY